MPAKRLLYFSSSQVSAFGWNAGTLTQDAVFASGEEAMPEFGKYVAGAPHALYYLLVDIVEEDFHQELIPYVRGGDRRTLLRRKLAQRYRDVSLALTASLGYETGPRREENILFASFTNTQPLQPWLAMLNSQKARVVGVYSPPLLAPPVAKRIGFAQKRFLLVSRQQAGMRQSFVDDGQIRFSRLGHIEGEDMAQRAQALAVETGRLQQYLTNMRMLARDGGALDVIVIAPDEALAEFQAACVNTPQTNYNVISSSDACKRAGLKASPEDLLAERLFLHTLAVSPPSQQFADDQHRRYFNLWRARIFSYATGAATFTFCVLLAALRLLDLYSVQSQAGADQQQERRLNDQYTRLQAQFQKTPTSTENLKGLVRNYIALEKQSVSPEKMFVELSKALAVVPQIELDRIEWQIGLDIKRAADLSQPAKSPPATAAPAAAVASGESPVFEVVQLNGRVNAAQASDYRNITILVNQFVAALRARPGVEVTSTQLPFDLTAEKSISGDIGAVRETEVPRFTVIFNRRVGS
jgi:hypothetical protein